MNESTKRKVLEAAASCATMSQAAKFAGMRYRTYIERAKKLGVYKPNRSARGIPNNNKGDARRIPLSEILDGLHPQYQTNKLRLRLLKEGIKENKCDECKITEWQKKPIVVELDHKDGDCLNHKLENLQMLCPNCHSQTPTFRGRNKR